MGMVQLENEIPQRLKAGTENKAFVAAVNGCATQEQEQMILSSCRISMCSRFVVVFLIGDLPSGSQHGRLSVWHDNSRLR